MSFFVVQVYPNRAGMRDTERLTLGTYSTHKGAIVSLTKASGKHLQIARECPNAVFVVRRISKVGKSSVRNTYTSSSLPQPISKHGAMASDSSGRKKGKIRARSFGTRRGDAYNGERLMASVENLAAFAVASKHPISHERQAFLRSNPMECHKARDPRR